MKYLHTIILLLAFNYGIGQVIVDLVECENSCIWTSDQTIRSWNVRSESPELLNDDLETPYRGLAIGHVNTSDSTVLNTFICADSSLGIKYWDGQNWLSLDIPPTFGILGIGSYKNNLYIYTSGPRLYYFDGQSFSEIDFPITSLAADIAVDSLGRAWCLSYDNDGDYFADSLHAIDKTGNEVFGYPLSQKIYGYGLYGMTIVNDTVHIGYGSSNLTFPNKIIGIAVENNTAIVTDKIIDFSGMNYSFGDLASKSPGNPLSITTSIENPEEQNLYIYPNPVSDFIVVEHNVSRGIEAALFSVTGKLLYHQQHTNSQFTINTAKLPKGIYFLHLNESIHKIIKK